MTIPLWQLNVRNYINISKSLFFKECILKYLGIKCHDVWNFFNLYQPNRGTDEESVKMVVTVESGWWISSCLIHASTFNVWKFSTIKLFKSIKLGRLPLTLPSESLLSLQASPRWGSLHLFFHLSGVFSQNFAKLGLSHIYASVQMSSSHMGIAPHVLLLHLISLILLWFSKYCSLYLELTYLFLSIPSN